MSTQPFRSDDPRSAQKSVQPAAAQQQSAQRAVQHVRSDERPRQSLLKVLLRNRHLQTHPAFAAEYEKTARRIDKSLIGSAPGREQLQRWLTGRVKTQPRPHHCRVLELMFPGHSTAELLAPYDPDRSLPVQAATSGSESASSHSAEPQSDPSHPTTPPNGARHEVVQLGSATVAAGLLSMVWRGPDRLEAALDKGTIGGGRLAFLDSEADRLGLRVVKVPPATLLEETVLLVSSVHDLLAERQPAAVQQQLARVGAKLSTIVAEILWNENHLVLARRWYQAAIRAATEAGDRLLADFALAGSTYLPAYGGDPKGVLAAVDPRLETGPAPSPAIAWLWAFKAKAHAALGERLAFEHALDAARTALERSPASLVRPGIFSFVPEKLCFYEAHGRIDLRDYRDAATAALNALARYDLTDTTEPTLVRLEHASALAQAGDLDEACALATRALQDPYAYHAASVVIQARAFDRQLGPTTRPTREWREFLADLRPPDPTALASIF